MAEDRLFGTAAADPLNDRSVIEAVRENLAAGKKIGNGRKARIIGNIAGGEDKRPLLAVQCGNFLFKRHNLMGRAGNIPRAACAVP